MHPLIYSCKLMQTPSDLGRFRLCPGDDLEIGLDEDHVAMMARPRTWASRFVGRGLRPVGRVGSEHEASLRPLIEEGRHMRVRVVNVDGFVDRPESITISVWVQG